MHCICMPFSLTFAAPNREVPEWLKGLAWKAGISQGIEGSNPFLSAVVVY